MNPEFKTLDQMIRRVVKKYNSFIICPFGDCGIQTIWNTGNRHIG